MDAVQTLQVSIAELDAYIQPLLNVKLDQLAGHRTPVERAKLASCLAYAVYSLYYSYVRTQGVDPSDHAVKNELLRVRDYMKKVKDVTAALQSSSDSATATGADGTPGTPSKNQEDRDPGQPKVDIAASARVIKASISKDSSNGGKGKKRAASRDSAKGSHSSKAGSKRGGASKAKKNRKK
eukprot:TRINITY_DN28498_c0_g1_i1.p1 TRINITY_DN28498_c0_g1~~TRINITY_DN28498_c0_g1_i1.p1  ORF type:complete len:181 (-),score=53.67 TRINITY_DN28498_c0_g1_i1:440-982(-)